ncbi:TM2 domain-containing protein 1 [Merluccius polli]|uniref:TM2 domain-containing protein 1 n=1 Tax=Merluccius polli TaxID=89951 RepID=A0AA47N1M9_MERPO|nr:TM2 domain-containing protein 1 [Merluccius polli]
MAAHWRRLCCFRAGLWSVLLYCLVNNLTVILAGEIELYPKIDEATQEAESCRDRVAWVECLPAPNISCRLDNGTEFLFSGEEVGFNRTAPCRNVTGYSYKVAVALSLFLGWLGADRFYLGYPALGLLKFCTVGFCGIGSLMDFLLIAMQVSSTANIILHSTTNIVLHRTTNTVLLTQEY